MAAIVLAPALHAHEGHGPVFQSDVSTPAKPWTHLEFQNDPDNFQFAIMSDRTGGPRAGVFEDAVQKLNWLRPEFVLSVGDFIKGNSANAQTNHEEWEEFVAKLAPLKMPFFFIAGNHDIQMKWLPNRVQPEEMQAQWRERFGPTHYSFLYKNVLFVALFSNDGKEASIGDEQVAYFERTMRGHPGVRWTIVLLHHPLWAYPHESNFDRIERALGGRKYTVIAGHQHRYVHFDRNSTNYYILATTGAGSRLRGTAFGEFDHVSWVTMTDDGPVLANLRLDGILPHDVTGPASIARVRALEAAGRIGAQVLLDGSAPVKRGSVYLALHNPSDRPLRIDGEFRHHHGVHPRPGVITRVLPPGVRESIEVDLAVVEPFAAGDREQLEFAAVVREGVGDDGAPTLAVNLMIPLVEHTIEVWATEWQEFAGSIEIAPGFDRDEREIRYTTDGSEPTRASPRFDRPVRIAESTVMKARFFARSGAVSPVDELRLTKIPPGQGLLCHYYERDPLDDSRNTMPIFAGLQPTLTRRVAALRSDAIARREENFAAVFFGWLQIDETGNHGFHLDSADGARLFIDGRLIIDDAIKHPRHEASGFAHLERGRHRIEVHYFQSNRDHHLSLNFTPPSGRRQALPQALLSFSSGDRPLLLTPQPPEIER